MHQDPAGARRQSNETLGPTLPTDPMGSRGIRWDPLGSVGICWDPLGSRGVRWDPVGCHGIQWDHTPKDAWDPVGPVPPWIQNRTSEVTDGVDPNIPSGDERYHWHPIGSVDKDAPKKNSTQA